MKTTWKKLIAGIALVAVLGSQVGIVSACPRSGRRATSSPAVNYGYYPATTPYVTYEPVAPETYAPVEVISETVTPAPAGLPATPVSSSGAATDLEMYDVRLIDRGDAEQGPSYRLIVKNLGQTAVTAEITVALLASQEKDSEEVLSVLGTLGSLEAGATRSIDLRLPKGAEALKYLTAAVATPSGEANEDDNLAIYEQAQVLSVR